jgi:hypothetical protein
MGSDGRATARDGKRLRDHSSLIRIMSCRRRWRGQIAIGSYLQCLVHKICVCMYVCIYVCVYEHSTNELSASLAWTNCHWLISPVPGTYDVCMYVCIYSGMPERDACVHSIYVFMYTYICTCTHTCIYTEWTESCPAYVDNDYEFEYLDLSGTLLCTFLAIVAIAIIRVLADFLVSSVIKCRGGIPPVSGVCKCMYVCVCMYTCICMCVMQRGHPPSLRCV